MHHALHQTKIAQVLSGASPPNAQPFAGLWCALEVAPVLRIERIGHETDIPAIRGIVVGQGLGRNDQSVAQLQRLQCAGMPLSLAEDMVGVRCGQIRSEIVHQLNDESLRVRFSDGAQIGNVLV